MALVEFSCGLEYSVTPDLRACLLEALRAKYAFIILPVVLPRFRWSHLSSDGAVPGFIRSEILSPKDWNNTIVARVSDYYDLDSRSQVVRRRHEDCLRAELAYCRHLGLSTVMLTLHSRNVNNLARNLQSHLESRYLSLLNMPNYFNHDCNDLIYYSALSQSGTAFWTQKMNFCEFQNFKVLTIMQPSSHTYLGMCADALPKNNERWFRSLWQWEGLGRALALLEQVPWVHRFW